MSKAICATVLAIAAEQSQQGLTPQKMQFDDPAFDFLPQAQPLSDPRKAQITVEQLLNHTSGITPEATGARNQGPWQHVLGHDGDPLTARLAFDPGTKCGYSSFAFYHASLVCEDVTGKPYDQFAIEALFRPIGVEHWTFEYFEGGGPEGDSRYGRHPSHSLGMPARDLARILLATRYTCDDDFARIANPCTACRAVADAASAALRKTGRIERVRVNFAFDRCRPPARWLLRSDKEGQRTVLGFVVRTDGGG